MILCFSGTGNSLYAARLISAAAGDEVVSLNALLRGGGAGALFLGAALRRSPARARLASACRGGGPAAPRRLGGQPEDVFLPHLRL